MFFEWLKEPERKKKFKAGSSLLEHSVSSAFIDSALKLSESFLYGSIRLCSVLCAIRITPGRYGCVQFKIVGFPSQKELRDEIHLPAQFTRS